MQLEAVRQQIAGVGRGVSNLEASLAAAEQAGNDLKVEFLRDRLKTMDKKEVALPEQETILLRAQQAGGYCSIATLRLALSWLYVRAFSWFALHISGNLAHRKCLLVATHPQVQEGAYF